jgi:hypothetical protein
MLDELRAAATQAGVTVETRHAAAESSDLPDRAFDLVLIADALHWMDAERTAAEVARMLARQGACAVVEVQLAATPFLQELQTVLRRANPKVSVPKPGRLTQLFRLALPRARRTSERFEDEVVLGEADFVGTLRSMSYVGPALGPAELAEVLGEAEALAARHGGAAWKREITVTWARGR